MAGATATSAAQSAPAAARRFVRQADLAALFLLESMLIPTKYERRCYMDLSDEAKKGAKNPRATVRPAPR
jgi:hypothetical protein